MRLSARVWELFRSGKDATKYKRNALPTSRFSVDFQPLDSGARVRTQAKQESAKVTYFLFSIFIGSASRACVESTVFVRDLHRTGPATNRF